MTNEEREIITGFIQRVSGTSRAVAGSVPAPALPPVDREADALIGDLFARLPEARYRLTQTAFVQEHALAQAQNRIKQLEFELDQAKRANQAAPGGFGGAQQPSRGFFGSLFGSGSPQSQPYPQYQQPQYQPPPPQYAPGYQPGMFQRSGSGFLGSALTTAAGVAGGMVVGNALMDLFSPHQGLGGGLGAGLGGGETVNVFPGGATEGSPWGGGPGNQGSAWDNQAAGPDQGSGGWGSGWDNASSNDAGTGGWDSSDSGFDSGGDSGGGFDNY